MISEATTGSGFAKASASPGMASTPAAIKDWNLFIASAHPHFAHHAAHVVHEVAVVGPAASGVGGDQVADGGARLHKNGVLAGNVIRIAGFQFAPHAMQVNRVSHHGVVHEHDA